MRPVVFFVKQDAYNIGLRGSNQPSDDSIYIDFLQRELRMQHGGVLVFDVLLKMQSERIAVQVSKMLSDLNEKNCSLRWWSYIFTAKNPLSSPLFNELVDIVLVLETVKQYCNAGTKIYIANSRYSHRIIIMRFFDDHQRKLNVLLAYNTRHLLLKIYGFSRAIVLVLSAFFSSRTVEQQFDPQHSEIGLLTYICGADRSQQDPYFGKLIEYLKNFEKKAVAYLFYFDRPISDRIKELKSEKNSFALLFKFISIKDAIWAIANVWKELFISYFDQPIVVSERTVSLYPLLKEYMIFEWGKGYTDNLLVFRAAKNISRKEIFETIIYPFENKSLEKCLLLGLGSKVKTIGYQHSSITPRHFTFRLNGREPDITPMPDKVITVGDVTQQWLIKTGHFPESKIYRGFSLRHNLDTKFDKKKFNLRKARLLFAFSSGFSEISDTIDFLAPVIEEYPGITYRFRNHINFPFDQLESSEQKWMERFIESGPRNSLLEDIDWADVVIYISSTVALEALFCGVPVLRLKIDSLNSDPLLVNQVPYKWECQETPDFFTKLRQIADLTDPERADLQQQSFAYVNKYLRKGSVDDYKLFLN